MTPLISVIIPVYNVEQYIVDCLESVRMQTFCDYEAIIVNDGTKDASAELAEQFIQEHGLVNWHVIHKGNGGLPSARNAGLDHAKGEWVFFLDSDDWIEPNALERLAACAKRNSSDLVIGGYQAYDQSTGSTEVWSKYPVTYGELPRDMVGLHSFGYCWGRLYKKEIIEKYSLSFDERLRMAEDYAWQFDYNSHITRYCCTNDVVYNYRVNREKSVTQKAAHPKIMQHVGMHMQGFLNNWGDLDWKQILVDNIMISRTMWKVLITDVINDILQDKIKIAYQKRKTTIAREIVETYLPRSRKEKVFRFLWRNSFIALIFCSKIYYKHFETLRRSKLVEVLSQIGR